MSTLLFNSADKVTAITVGDMAYYNKSAKTLTFTRDGERLYFGCFKTKSKDDKRSLHNIDISIILECYTSASGLIAVKQVKDYPDYLLVWEFQYPR